MVLKCHGESWYPNENFKLRINKGSKEERTFQTEKKVRTKVGCRDVP